MALMVVLAHGIPGQASESPSEQYVDEQIRLQLAADETITIVTDPAEARPGKPRTRARRNRKRRGKPKPYVRNYRAIALKAAKKAGVRNPKLFVRQIAAESGFQPCARSGAGAIGIAQIMPATARSWKVDPFQPESALTVAARHMARYEKQYGSFRLALAAYNAGPGSVSRYNGVPPYAETRGYIQRITRRGVPLGGMNSHYRLPAGMQSGFRRKLLALKRDVNRRGGRLRINDGWRSYEEQLRLWKQAKKRYGGWQNATRWVAPPGCSNHNRGWAADLSGNLRLAHRLAPRHGLVFPMQHEPWHVELAGIATQSG